jgi:hypothetical protein
LQTSNPSLLWTPRRIKQLQAQGSLPTDGVKVLVAGLAQNTSQKLHNMIYAIERVDETAELVLMLDDDMLMVRAPVPPCIALDGTRVQCGCPDLFYSLNA